MAINGGKEVSVPEPSYLNDPALAAQVADECGLTDRQRSVIVRRASGMTFKAIGAQDGRTKNGTWNIYRGAVERIERERSRAARFTRARAWLLNRDPERFDREEPKVVTEARSVVMAWEALKIARDMERASRIEALEREGAERIWQNGVARKLLEGADLE